MDAPDNEYLNYCRILKFLNKAKIKMHQIFCDRWLIYKNLLIPGGTNYWIDGDICGAELLLLMPKLAAHFRDTVKNGHVELWDITVTNQAITAVNKAIRNNGGSTDIHEDEFVKNLADTRNSVLHGVFHLSDDQFKTRFGEIKDIMIKSGISVSDIEGYESKLLELGQTKVKEGSYKNTRFNDLKKVAKAFFNTKKFEGAIKAYNEMLNTPGLPPENQSEIFANRSDAYYWLKTDDSLLKAKRDAECAIELNPYWEAFYFLGRVQMDLEEWNAAKEALYAARKQNPKSKEVKEAIIMLEFLQPMQIEDSKQKSVQKPLTQLFINKNQNENLIESLRETNTLTPKKKENEVKNVDGIQRPWFVFQKNDVLKASKKVILNILLLGEVGVGKSTFINSVANYLTYQTLEEALSKPICLIPNKFTFYETPERKLEIKTEQSHGRKCENEVFSESGETSTQEPQIYQFETSQYILNFIDTPGIGDTRGFGKDQENTKKILGKLENCDKIHAICILLKSTERRLTTSFRYCISILLLQLSRKEVDNIIFFFNNSRITFYQPGDAIFSIRVFLENIKNKHHLDIPLTKHNIFCIDNEWFRKICAHANGIPISHDNFTYIKKSWKKSANEIDLFLILAARPHPYLETDSISINKARIIVLRLAKTMADIIELIESNIIILNDQKKEVWDISLVDFQKKLKTSLIDIEVRELNIPRIVCRESKCIKFEIIPNTEQYRILYNQICHENNFFKNEDLEKVPDPNVLKSMAMNGENCTICGCHWSTHMPLRFEQIKFVFELEDEAFMNFIKQNEDPFVIKEKYVKKMWKYN